MADVELLPCGECGMPCRAGEYHPFAACLMFKACHNSETVRANLAPPPHVDQQLVAVDDAMVDRAGRVLYGTDWGSFEGWEADQLKRKVRAVLTAALAAQHQESRP